MEATTVLHKHKVIAPKLRFKGFNDIWKSCMLNDVTQYTKGFAFKSDDYKDEGTRIIRVSDLGADRIKTDNEKIFIETANINLYEKYKLISGNIIITTVGSKPELLESAVGRGIFVKKDHEGLLNQNLLKFDNIKGVDNGFIMGLINSKKYQLHIKGIARGNANQANITVVDLLQYKLAIPALPEQQKIASFLSAVDEKIQQFTRKKELLEQYKKGVMQQLFSGKLRFKDENGKAFPKWEEKRLGDVCEYKNGGSFENLVGDDGLYNLISLNSIDINGKLKPEHKKVSENDNSLSKGDLVMVLSDVAHGYFLGLTDVIPAENYVLNQRMGALKPKVNIDTYYLKTIINTNQRYFKLMGQGSSQKNLSKDDVLNFTFQQPDLEEQKKIANYLSNIDNKIEIVNKQITQTQTFKKGLLQQMFV